MCENIGIPFWTFLSWFHFSSPLVSTLMVHNDCCKPYFCT
jgi:hypothetical protein